MLSSDDFKRDSLLKLPGSSIRGNETEPIIDSPGHLFPIRNHGALFFEVSSARGKSAVTTKIRSCPRHSGHLGGCVGQLQLCLQ